MNSGYASGKRGILTKLQFPPLGQRIVRSVVAVALCFVIYYLRGKQGIVFYSTLAVLQCIQPYNASTKQFAKNRTTGTLVGAFWGLVVILILSAINGGIGHEIHDDIVKYLLISLFTGMVLYSTVVLDVKKSSYFSCVVFLSITVMHMGDESPLLFVWNRVLDTMIGIVLAMIVNAIHLPRTKNEDVLFVSGVDDTILNSENALTPYSKVELNRLIEDGAKFTVSTIRTPASVREALPDINLKLPVIVMDGAVLYDMKEDSYLIKYEMSHAQAEKMSNYLDRVGFNYFTNTVTEDLLVIYYRDLTNDAERSIYKKRRRSPYRNYLKTETPVYDHVVYFLVMDKKDKIEKLYEEMIKLPWMEDYRLALLDSHNYPGYAHIKIYHKDASREHMLKNLCERLNVDQIMTFGSVEGKYDVLIKDADRNIMVKELKKRYEPVKLFGRIFL